MSHKNDGNCLQCRKIIGKFPGFYQPLAIWFFAFQKDHPEAHCSEAGRDEIAQEAFFQRGSSKARWKESAHNWNAALDLFEQGGKDRKNIYEAEWFLTILKPRLPVWIDWAGEWKTFRETPHIEVRDWRNMVKRGELQIVGKDDHA